MSSRPENSFFLSHSHLHLNVHSYSSVVVVAVFKVISVHEVRLLKSILGIFSYEQTYSYFHQSIIHARHHHILLRKVEVIGNNLIVLLDFYVRFRTRSFDAYDWVGRKEKSSSRSFSFNLVTSAVITRLEHEHVEMNLGHQLNFNCDVENILVRRLRHLVWRKSEQDNSCLMEASQR